MRKKNRNRERERQRGRETVEETGKKIEFT